MELRQLRYFVAVAEEGSFTRAAARVRVAQPGISAQIQRLERELGQELLDRSGRAVRLTEVGAAVLPHARAVLAAVEQTRLVVDELTGLLRGRVRVGMVPACGSVGVPDLLAGFHRRHPEVEITLSEDTSDRLLAELAGGRLDLGVVGVAGADPDGVALHVVADERLALAVDPGHPLAGRVEIGPEDLAGQPLICLPRGAGLRAALDDLCARAGVTPRIAFEAGDPQVLAQLAERGLGAAVLPEPMARADPRRLCPVALAAARPGEAAPRARLALAWRRGGPAAPAARALVAHARATLPPVRTPGAGAAGIGPAAAAPGPPSGGGQGAAPESVAGAGRGGAGIRSKRREGRAGIGSQRRSGRVQ